MNQIESRSFSSSHILIGISLFIVLITCLSIVFAPGILSSFFTGPDGLMWLRPFLIFMGSFFVLYSLFPLINRNFEFKGEKFIGGACLVFFLGLFLFVGIQRFTSGLRLIEAYNEVMNIRISQGQSIYPDPETAPMGVIYTPFFFMVSGLFHKLLPDGFGYGRIVCILSTLGTAFFVFKISLQRKSETTSAIWASALFFATNSIMATIYDQSFVDSLLMLVICITLSFFLQNSLKGDMLALFFTGLACFTKQTGIYSFIVVLIFLIISRRKLWVFSPLIFWGAVAGTLILITKGWAYTYLVTYPLGHGFRNLPPSAIMSKFFLWQAPLWIGVIWGILQNRQKRFLFFFLSILLTSLFGVFKVGGWFNALVPIEPLLCIVAADTLRHRKLLLICQLILGVYNPFTAVYPWTTIRYADKEIVALARNADGEVWLPMDSYLYKSTDKKEWDNICALFGPGWSGYPPPERLIKALDYKKFHLIIIRKSSMTLFRLFHPKIKQLIKQNYMLEETEQLNIYRRIESNERFVRNEQGVLSLFDL